MAEDIFKEHDNSLSVELTNINKSSLSDIASSIIQTVDDGYKDALDVLIQAKGLEELSKMISDGVKQWAMNEAEGYPKADAKRLGVGFTLKGLPNKYDFSHDEKWCALNDKIKQLQAEIKEREKFMVEAIKYNGITTSTGEVIPPATIASHGGQTIQITIPKN